MQAQRCTILAASSSFKWVDIATLRRFYPQEIAPLPIVKKAGWEQRQSARVWETEELFPKRSSTPNSRAPNISLYGLH